METANNDKYDIEMNKLCSSVKNFIMDEDYESCIIFICTIMSRYPHSPQPHNLLAIVLEKTGNHSGAMKHFQAALALDPDYLPAKYNLNTCGTFFTRGIYAFDENDVTQGTFEKKVFVFDGKNVGHVEYKSRIIYDEYGIGHVVGK